MKHLIALIAILISCGNVIAQSTPMGINYQGVARDLAGNVIADQDISIKISLISDIYQRKIAYSETHLVTTNKLGLFTLIVGSGNAEKGNFINIPWSSSEIWFDLSIDSNGGRNYENVSTSRLLAVPYALHAGTAGEISGSNFNDNRQQLESRGNGNPGVPANVWHTDGNSRTDPTVDFLGTTDCTDLVIITDYEERMRITCAGVITISNDEESTNCDNGALVVAGGVGIGKNLNLGGKLHVKDVSTSNTPKDGAATVVGGVGIGDNLNVGGIQGSEAPDEGAIIVAGGVGIGQNLNVGGDKSSPPLIRLEDGSYLPPNDSTGAVVIVGGVGIGENLNVGGNIAGSGQLASGQVLATEATDASSCDDAALQSRGGLGITGDAFFCNDVDITGTLNVDQNAMFNSKLFVSDSTLLDNTLDVAGATLLHSTLEIIGTTKMNDNLTVEAKNEEFIAKFSNTQGGTGDGIQIKLGRTHPAWQSSTEDWLEASEPVAWANKETSDLIKGWMFGGGGFKTESALDDINDLTKEALDIRLMLDAAVCQIGTQILEPVSGALDPALGALVSAVNALGGIIDPIISVVNIGCGTELTPDCIEFSASNVSWNGLSNVCDVIPADPTKFITIRSNNVDNSLTKENQFLSFVDKEDRQLGSINAVSLGNWADGYFDLFYVMEFVGAVATIDPVKSFTGFYGKYAEAAKSYNSIGVEYTSGHGDYAEWLERIDHAEVISRGDIVAVKGGKITKDIKNAEQIMAVSEFPIVLGNVPNEDEKHLGHNVAFMGQIPVKITGPVHSGDYIVASEQIPGYGIAINPQKIKAEELALVVGRSWETHEGKGPKLVNTVIGVHNGDYINILKKFENKFKESEARLENLESKIDILFAESEQAKAH